MNIKNGGMVGARRAVASKVGASVINGGERRSAADNRGQPRGNCKLKSKIFHILYLNQSNFASTVPYRTIL